MTKMEETLNQISLEITRDRTSWITHTDKIIIQRNKPTMGIRINWREI